jgi:hypothetical protein
MYTCHHNENLLMKTAHLKNPSLHLQYREMVAAAWAELPVLVSQFVARAAKEIGVTRQVLEDAVAETLTFPSYASFESVCALLSRIYPYLADDQPEDHDLREGSASGNEIRGQAWAALKCWKTAGWDSVAVLDWRNAEPMAALPYEELGDDEKLPSRSAGFAVLNRFLEEATGFREQVLDGFVVCRSTASTEEALNLALDLADVLARSVDSDIPLMAAELLTARGITDVSEDELAEMWDDDSGFTVEDWSLLERGEDPSIDSHAARLERLDAGHPTAWQLRNACVAYSPNALGGYYDDSPTLFGVITQAPAEARFRINAMDDGPQEYLVPAVHFQGFVRTLEEVPAMLRCAPRMPAELEIVSHDEAMRLGYPGLAGWYCLSWLDCL